MRKKKPADTNESQIGNLLLRYKKHLKPPQASVEKECVEVIKEITNFLLKDNQVKYTVSSRTVHLQIPSLLKSELKAQYPNILLALKNRLGAAHSPTTIL